MNEISPLLSQYGLWIVFVGMMVEGTTVILLSGVFCHMGILPLEQTIVVSIVGAVIGDQAWFYMGHHYAQKILSKFPSLNKQVTKITPSIHSKANWFAIGSRFVYGGAVIFPLALGVHHYSRKKFTILDLLGVTFASMIGVSIGYFLSDSVAKISGDINSVEHLVLLLIIVTVVIKFYKSKRV